MHPRASCGQSPVFRSGCVCLLIAALGFPVWGQSIKKCRDARTGAIAYVDLSCPPGSQEWATPAMADIAVSPSEPTRTPALSSASRLVLQAPTVRLIARPEGGADVALEGRWFNPHAEPLVVLYRVWLRGDDAAQHKVVNRYWRLEPKTTTPMQDLLLKTAGPDGLGFTPQQVHMVYFTQDDPTEHWVNGITVQR